MSVQTIELNPTRQRKTEAGTVIAYAGAVAFAIAAAWYGLARHGITQSSPPHVGPTIGEVPGLHFPGSATI